MIITTLHFTYTLGITLAIGIVIVIYLSHKIFVPKTAQYTVEDACKFLRDKGFWITLNVKPKDEQ